MDPVRVLAELSGLVVSRLVDEDDAKERARSDDPFGRALVRLAREGEPAPTSGWRRALEQSTAADPRAATVLKRLTRDLLSGITVERPVEATPEPATEIAPDNVHPITDALQPTPGFEQSQDGRWRPAAPSEEDLLRGYRPRTPRLGSRYPES